MSRNKSKERRKKSRVIETSFELIKNHPTIIYYRVIHYAEDGRTYEYISKSESDANKRYDNPPKRI